MKQPIDGFSTDFPEDDDDYPPISLMPARLQGRGSARARRVKRVSCRTASRSDLCLSLLPSLDESGKDSTTLGRSLLADPESLPLRDLSAIDRQRVVIVAPHPDDETLGCGGAISLLTSKGYRVKVAIVSDGTGSHPNSQKYPAPALQAIRSQETIAALEILGVTPPDITFLQLKDGAVPTVTSPNFLTAKALCRNYLQATLPDTIFLPWRHDPHADHRASWQLIQAAILSLGIAPQVIEYPIWDWDRQQQQQICDLSRIDGWRLDISSVITKKTQAIASYRSQLGQLIDDDPNGFCLSPEILTNFTRPWEVYFEEII
jgi:LmbE family N-acetylglucosaminyl deacetylase